MPKVRFAAFPFPPANDRWLTVLRVGLGLQVILYCLSLKQDWHHLLGGTHTGLIDRNLMESIISIDAPFVPKLGWLVALGTRVGITEQSVLWISWIALLCAGYLVLLGLFCRTSAVAAWFIYLSATKSTDFLSYGMDNFTTIGLFYLVLAPLPDRYALDRKLWKSPVKDRHLHGFFRRVLQLHLCIIYFFGGIAKALGAGWWNGDSLWMALTRPPFNVVPLHIIISSRYLLPFLGIAVVLLETGYPIFIWLKRTRLIWLIAIVCMHIAIGLTMGLYLFALVMIVLNLAAFGSEFLFGERRSEDSLSTRTTNSAALGS